MSDQYEQLDLETQVLQEDLEKAIQQRDFARDVAKALLAKLDQVLADRAQRFSTFPH